MAEISSKPPFCMSDSCFYLYLLLLLFYLFIFFAIPARASQIREGEGGNFECEGRNYCTIFLLQAQKYPFILLATRMCLFLEEQGNM